MASDDSKVDDEQASHPPQRNKTLAAAVAAKNIVAITTSYVVDVKTLQHSRIIRAMTGGTTAHLPRVLALCEFWVNVGFVDDSQLPQINGVDFDPCYIVAKERNRFWTKKDFARVIRTSFLHN
jgi:hypothetical protein